MKPIKQINILFFALIPFFCSFSQSDTLFLGLRDPFISSEELFEDTSVFECSLEFNIKQFQDEVNNNSYQPAFLIYRNSNQVIVKKKIRVKPRGITRKEICAIPPFWMNVWKDKSNPDTNNNSLKIKVVSHCNYAQVFDDYLFKEYLVYKLYNLTTPYSFRVRLMKITYIDVGRNRKQYTRYGFMIEPLETLCKRTDAVPINLQQIGFYHTEPALTDIFCMWSFMMGNFDWSFAGQHNIKLIKLNDVTKPYLIPVPYDFDYTGFVNTNYAVPTEGLGLKNVRERLFLGPCREMGAYDRAIQHLIDNKENYYNYITNFIYLNKGSSNDAMKFLDGFYTTIQKPGYIKYHIDTDCRETERKEVE